MRDYTETSEQADHRNVYSLKVTIEKKVTIGKDQEHLWKLFFFRELNLIDKSHMQIKHFF